jgi:hypothetical protein
MCELCHKRKAKRLARVADVVKAVCLSCASKVVASGGQVVDPKDVVMAEG